MGSLLLNKYTLSLLGALALAGYIWYQNNKIENLSEDLNTANQSIVTLTLNLSNEITKRNDIVNLQKELSKNQLETKKEISKLWGSTSKLDVIKAKPTLVSKKIENSYEQFHLEKACYSGNTEACDAK